jgi:hypothetical protein
MGDHYVYKWNCFNSQKTEEPVKYSLKTNKTKYNTCITNFWIKSIDLKDMNLDIEHFPISSGIHFFSVVSRMDRTEI